MKKKLFRICTKANLPLQFHCSPAAIFRLYFSSLRVVFQFDGANVASLENRTHASNWPWHHSNHWDHRGDLPTHCYAMDSPVIFVYDDSHLAIVRPVRPARYVRFATVLQSLRVPAKIKN